MQQYTRFLRLFGVTAGELTPLLKAAAAQGCPGLRLLQKDGECVICVSAQSADNRSILVADRWADQIREKLGPEFYGEGTTTLAMATADALAARGKLMVACDEDTGLGLSELLRESKTAASSYDFGKYSWGDRRRAAKLKARRGHQGLAAAVDRARAALKITGADYALLLLREPEAPAALLCTPTEGYLYPLAGARDVRAQGLNALLDMARRLALGRQTASPVLRFGRKDPLPQLPREDEKPAFTPQRVETRDEEPRQPEPDPEQAPLFEEKPETEEKTPSAPEDLEGKGAFQAAWALYNQQLNEEGAEPAPAPYSARPKSYRRRVMACAVAVLAVAALAGIGSWYARSFGSVPVYRGYGTVGFDTSAQEYLAKAQAKDAAVQGYLAFRASPAPWCTTRPMRAALRERYWPKSPPPPRPPCRRGSRPATRARSAPVRPTATC